MPGIQINSLQDLLLLRELNNQADPVRSSLKALADGVSSGIEASRAEQRQKRILEEQRDTSLKAATDFANTQGGKVQATFDGKNSKFTVTPIQRLADVPKGFEVTKFNAKGEPTFTKIPPGGSLPPEMQIKARALARKIAGVRGAEKILPSIEAGLNEGKTIDDIEDSIRLGGQSEALTGPIRDAAQSILINSPVVKSERTLDFIDDQLSKGNVGAVKDLLKKSSRDNSGIEMSRNILGKERTTEFFEEIQSDLDALEASGVDTNIFTGTVEDINKKIGRVKSPDMRKIATKIKVAIQNYRRSMSGVAFSEPEAKEYRDIFPSIGRTANFNRVTLEALNEVITGDVRNFYRLSMGRDNYDKLFGDELAAPVQQDGLSDEEAFKIFQQQEI